MSTEWRTLFLAVQYAADHEWNTHAIELADAVAQFFDDAVHWEEADEIHRRALMAGQELEIPWAAAQAHLNLAVIQWRTGRNQDAFTSPMRPAVSITRSPRPGRRRRSTRLG